MSGLYGGFYTVGGLFGGGSIWWGVYTVGGSIRGDLFGEGSIWWGFYTVGYTIFFPFGYLGINNPSVLGDPEKCLTRSNLV